LVKEIIAVKNATAYTLGWYRSLVGDQAWLCFTSKILNETEQLN
jgi:hypothetical protein